MPDPRNDHDERDDEGSYGPREGSDDVTTSDAGMVADNPDVSALPQAARDEDPEGPEDAEEDH